MEWWNQISHWWFWVSDYFSYPYAIQEDIQIMSDSSTVIPYINNMVGSRSIILRSSLWSTQIWLPAVLRLVVLTPIIINSSHLPLPGTKQRQPLYQQIKLTAFLLPKDTSKHNHSRPIKTVILAPWRNMFCCKGKVDPFQPDVT